MTPDIQRIENELLRTRMIDDEIHTALTAGDRPAIARIISRVYDFVAKKVESFGAFFVDDDEFNEVRDD